MLFRTKLISLLFATYASTGIQGASLVILPEGDISKSALQAKFIDPALVPGVRVIHGVQSMNSRGGITATMEAPNARIPSPPSPFFTKALVADDSRSEKMALVAQKRMPMVKVATPKLEAPQTTSLKFLNKAVGSPQISNFAMVKPKQIIKHTPIR